jgi:hypothetical protein
LRRCLTSKKVIKKTKKLVCIEVFSKQESDIAKKYGVTRGFAFIILDPEGNEVNRYSGDYSEDDFAKFLEEMAEKYTYKPHWHEVFTGRYEKIYGKEKKPVLILIYKKKKDKLDAKSKKVFDELEKIPISGYAKKFVFIKLEFHKKCKMSNCSLCLCKRTYGFLSVPCIILVNLFEKSPKKQLIKKFGSPKAKKIEGALKYALKKFKKTPKKKKKS